jgi:hypothetical protein
MGQAEHALLELPAAASLIAGGMIVLALAWRRGFRGESSGVVISPAPLRQTVASIAVIPVAGLIASAVVVLGAAIINGRLRLP